MLSCENLMSVIAIIETLVCLSYKFSSTDVLSRKRRGQKIEERLFEETRKPFSELLRIVWWPHMATYKCWWGLLLLYNGGKKVFLGEKSQNVFLPCCNDEFSFFWLLVSFSSTGIEMLWIWNRHLLLITCQYPLSIVFNPGIKLTWFSMKPGCKKCGLVWIWPIFIPDRKRW